MGLAGPRNKQRISVDPQNKHWANDTSKFGYKMMEKMGWKQGKGLGAKENGMAEHVKIRMKQDNLGVGADKRSIDNWLDNTNAFSALLESLNEQVQQGETGPKEEEPCKIEKKQETQSDTVPPAKFGRLYHRTKWLRNKAVTNYDSTDLNMILGVKNTAEQDPFALTLASTEDRTPEMTSASSSDSEASASMEDKTNPCALEVTVKTTNMNDYFRNKMAARLGGAASQLLASSTSVDVDDERPSFGLGATGLGFSMSHSPKDDKKPVAEPEMPKKDKKNKSSGEKMAKQDANDNDAQKDVKKKKKKKIKEQVEREPVPEKESPKDVVKKKKSKKKKEDNEDLVEEKGVKTKLDKEKLDPPADDGNVVKKKKKKSDSKRKRDSSDESEERSSKKKAKKKSH